VWSHLATTICNAIFRATSRHEHDSGGGRKGRSDPRDFTTSDAIIRGKPVDPKHPGLQMFAVVGESKQGRLEILQKFAAGMDSGWHWHSAAYQASVIQGKLRILSREQHRRQAAGVRVVATCGTGP